MAKEVISDEVKGIAKAISKLVEVFKFTKDNWWLLAIFGTMIWGTAKMYYYTQVEPEVRGYVTTIIYDMGKDSIPKMVHSILENQPVGFRGLLADTTKIPKEELVGVLGNIIVNYSKLEVEVIELKNEVSYLNEFTIFLLETLYTKDVYRGVTYYVTQQGDFKYLDMYKKLWDASYNAACDCYYYYPNYANGQRLKCE